MNREEIVKEAQEQVNYCTPLYPECFIQGYLAGAEPRENKIADIKANCDLTIEGRDVKIMELEQKLEQTEKDLADYQFNYPTIKELEKENAELKETIGKLREQFALRYELEDNLKKENADLEKKLNMFASLSTDSCFAHHEKAKMLEQAKEHIRTLISCLIDWVQEGDKYYCYIADAEQFLEKIEK